VAVLASHSTLDTDNLGLTVPAAGNSGTYLRLSGTSMSAAVTTGVVAVLVEANRAASHGSGDRLTPNATKAVPLCILATHLLPATRGFLIVQATLLLLAFILAEATLSYIGLGFAPPAASWGVMLGEASNISGIADFPWLLSPAAAIIAVVFAVNVVSGAGTRGGALGAITPARRVVVNGS